MRHSFNLRRPLSYKQPPVLSKTTTITNAQKHDQFFLPSQLTNSDHSFYSEALKVSAKFGLLRQGKQLHAHVMKLGLCNKLHLQNQMLHVFVKCKAFDDAKKLFDAMPVRNVVTWNTVICGIVNCGGNFMSYFRRMLLDHVRLDQITFNGLLRACVEVDDIELGKKLHCFIVKVGFDLNCFVSSALVDLYGKCGLVEDARRVFDEILCRDLVVWNVMVSCYALNCLADEAFVVFNLMQLEGMKGDGFTFASLANSCGTLGGSELGKQIHSHIIKQSFDLDVLVATSLIDMYAKSGNIHDARMVFDRMAGKNVVSWNAMIVGYGRYGDGREAVKLLRDMLQESFYPDEVTLTSILSSCGSLSITCETLQAHAYVVRLGVQVFLSIGNALINAYSKCGSIASAFQCFSSITEPDLVTWTSIIGAYAFHGHSKESIEFFEKMLSQEVRPDKIAFLEVISACSHGGLVSEGLRYFNLMINKYQIVPDLEHYTCLIDLLGRAGLLDEASNMLESMPIEPGSDTLAAFIGACKVHGSMGLAKRAAEKLFELEPSKPVSYALVSNIYASEKCWFDVARLRKIMKKICDPKVPGCSWVEIAGKSHTFVSGDNSHPQSVDIHTILGTLFGLTDENSVSSPAFDNELDECML